MLRVFVDTSVLFAAVYSASGTAYDLMILASADRVNVIVSQDVLEEVERNIRKKMPHRMDAYRTLVVAANVGFASEPQPEIVQSVATYVVGKDVHVIAAAIAARPDYLVTYDRKHLLDVPEVAARSGLKIVTPDVVVALINDQA